MKSLTCQSCGMPFLCSLKGTNWDETENEEFCANCFEKEQFIDPSLSLHKLEMKLVEMAEVHKEITIEDARVIIKKLPYLKRWHMNIM